MANITTLHGVDGEDHSCILEPNEHPFIKQRSWVRFRDVQNGNLQGINDNPSVFKRHEDMTPTVLRKVVEGALKSPGLSTENRTQIEEDIVSSPLP